jgi:hypothetical protein
MIRGFFKMVFWGFNALMAVVVGIWLFALHGMHAPGPAKVGFFLALFLVVVFWLVVAKLLAMFVGMAGGSR